MEELVAMIIEKDKFENFKEDVSLDEIIVKYPRLLHVVRPGSIVTQIATGMNGYTKYEVYAEIGDIYPFANSNYRAAI